MSVKRAQIPVIKFARTPLVPMHVSVIKVLDLVMMVKYALVSQSKKKRLVVINFVKLQILMSVWKVSTGVFRFVRTLLDHTAVIVQVALSLMLMGPVATVR